MNPDPFDALNKSRHVVAAMPREWLAANASGAQSNCKEDLVRMANYLKLLGNKSGGRDFVQVFCCNIQFAVDLLTLELCPFRRW